MSCPKSTALFFLIVPCSLVLRERSFFFATTSRQTSLRSWWCSWNLVGRLNWVGWNHGKSPTLYLPWPIKGLVISEPVGRLRNESHRYTHKQRAHTHIHTHTHTHTHTLYLAHLIAQWISSPLRACVTWRWHSNNLAYLYTKVFRTKLWCGVFVCRRMKIRFQMMEWNTGVKHTLIDLDHEGAQRATANLSWAIINNYGPNRYMFNWYAPVK